jgi:hypothetical protein
VTDRLPLPHLLAELADVAGTGAALAFAAEYGGRIVYVPRTLAPDHRFIAVLGREGAERLVELRGGENVTIPYGPAGTVAQARRRMVQALEAGKSGNEAAAAGGMTQRTAFRIKKRMRDGSQGSLF